MDRNAHLETLAGTRLAVDIGSTVVKVARVGPDNQLLTQQFYPRDFEAGIARQVESLLAETGADPANDNVLVCSSANGGLRVGIVALTRHFTGAVVRDQVLLAGANPVYLRTLDDEGGDTAYVDMLIVSGGIDGRDAPGLEQRLARFQPGDYRYGALVYAGNRALADAFTARHPAARAIPNPVPEKLSAGVPSVFETVRRAYLDDLVYKEGVSELNGNLSRGIRPTPEVVNRGFHRALLNASSIEVPGASVLFDIGGATTDIHYAVELVRDESEHHPQGGSSVARYVFTDLGVVASRDSLMLQLRTHPRLYNFLDAVIVDEDVRDVYRLLREGEYEAPARLLSYACLFIALDRFASGRGPGLPAADLGKLAHVMLTGGAAQVLDEAVVDRVTGLLVEKGAARPTVYIDRGYRLWVDGITWKDSTP